jgi:hypothetical protein
MKMAGRQAAALKSISELEFNARTALFRQLRISDCFVLLTRLRLRRNISCQYSISACSRKRLEDSISFAQFWYRVLTRGDILEIILILPPRKIRFPRSLHPMRNEARLVDRVRTVVI